MSCFREPSAYDTEVDLVYRFSDGNVAVKTLFLGNIQPNSTDEHSVSINSTNKQLESCTAEVYWYD